MVVLSTGETTTSGMLAVLSDTLRERGREGERSGRGREIAQGRGGTHTVTAVRGWERRIQARDEEQRRRQTLLRVHPDGTGQAGDRTNAETCPRCLRVLEKRVGMLCLSKRVEGDGREEGRGGRTRVSSAAAGSRDGAVGGAKSRSCEGWPPSVRSIELV